MIFIKPILQMNANRAFKVHTLVFFIILVCNVGGCLSAIGDPPLFVGFLYGVPFFWPTFNLFMPFITLLLPILLLYYIVDGRYFRKENSATFLKDFKIKTAPKI